MTSTPHCYSKPLERDIRYLFSIDIKAKARQFVLLTCLVVRLKRSKATKQTTILVILPQAVDSNTGIPLARIQSRTLAAPGVA